MGMLRNRLILLVVLPPLVFANVLAQTANVSVIEVRDSLKANHARMKSVGMDVVLRSVYHDDYLSKISPELKQAMMDNADQSFFWAYSNGKYRESAIVKMADAKPPTPSEHIQVFDGEKLYTFFGTVAEQRGESELLQGGIQESDALSRQPRMLHLGFRDNTKWYEELIGDGWTVEGERVDPKLGTLTILTQSGGEKLTLEVSVRLGLVVTASRAATVQGIPVTRVATVEDVVSVAGVNLPLTGSIEYKDLTGKPIVASQYVFSGHRVNDLDESLFEPIKFPPHTQVSDHDAGLQYTIPPARQSRAATYVWLGGSFLAIVGLVTFVALRRASSTRRTT
jgi:hypothetical protein